MADEETSGKESAGGPERPLQIAGEVPASAACGQDRAQGSDPAPIPRRLSPAALDAYLTCPKRFALGWLREGRRQSLETPAMAQGKAIHAALEKIMGLEPEERSAENSEAALRSVWAEERGQAFADREQEAAAGTESINLLRTMAEAGQLASKRVLAREQWVSFRLGSGIELYGKVDRIDRSHSNPQGLEIIDYKTGRAPKDLEELDPREISTAAEVYAVAATKMSGWPVERVRFIYLRAEAGRNEARLELEAEDLELAERRLDELVNRIAEDSHFASTPGPQCQFCSYRLICPDSDPVTGADLVSSVELPF
jgi:putative RecB family exonuclease